MFNSRDDNAMRILYLDLDSRAADHIGQCGYPETRRPISIGSPGKGRSLPELIATARPVCRPRHFS